ncbi:hypothetical protein DUNSADRAFT_17021 [Dunaliella salina]|uniref:Uncharacterized protein n=1 Tax=Dunaliella salina TaxID=3046 RepID=A0ABQ7G2H7_DUNSA|nr:hypothetical protein DUNSADRAFT_17021 [Dunaliella salina]|eukprot:KAF5828804.1 hypothetical protein DUNSADRAFT_17021 [Dunaliella salina]
MVVRKGSRSRLARAQKVPKTVESSLRTAARGLLMVVKRSSRSQPTAARKMPKERVRSQKTTATPAQGLMVASRSSRSPQTAARKVPKVRESSQKTVAQVQGLLMVRRGSRSQPARSRKILKTRESSQETVAQARGVMVARKGSRSQPTRAQKVPKMRESSQEAAAQGQGLMVVRRGSQIFTSKLRLALEMLPHMLAMLVRRSREHKMRRNIRGNTQRRRMEERRMRMRMRPLHPQALQMWDPKMAAWSATTATLASARWMCGELHLLRSQAGLQWRKADTSRATQQPWTTAWLLTTMVWEKRWN